MSAGASHNSAIRDAAIGGDTVGWISAAQAESEKATETTVTLNADDDIAGLLKARRE
jgi:hypothetical protein